MGLRHRLPVHSTKRERIGGFAAGPSADPRNVNKPVYQLEGRPLESPTL